MDSYRVRIDRELARRIASAYQAKDRVTVMALAVSGLVADLITIEPESDAEKEVPYGQARATAA